MLRHLPKGSLYRSYRIGKEVKERPYGDPLHRCSLTLTAVPLCPAGEALVTSAKQTPRKPIADPALRALLLADISRLCREIFDPQKFDSERMSLCGILSALRMTQDGCSSDAFAWRVVKGADPYRGCCRRQDDTRRMRAFICLPRRQQATALRKRRQAKFSLPSCKGLGFVV